MNRLFNLHKKIYRPDLLGNYRKELDTIYKEICGDGTE
jgi:hypothetical protein